MNYPVAVVGGGQADLSMSYWLTQHGIGHVVLERDRIGQEWRELRWDSFCRIGNTSYQDFRTQTTIRTASWREMRSSGISRVRGSTKIVDPGGEILAGTSVRPGMAIIELDIQQARETARRSMAHLHDRHPDAYLDAASPELNSRAFRSSPDSSGVRGVESTTPPVRLVLSGLERWRQNSGVISTSICNGPAGAYPACGW